MNYSIEEIEEYLLSIKEMKFRAKQLFQWIYKDVQSFSMMTNLPATLRENLEKDFFIGSLKQVKKVESSDGNTIKYLFSLQDHNIIECVVMKYSYGNTLCLTTQVGCKMGCRFCASTKGGLVRNLLAGEMAAQVLKANWDEEPGKNRSIRNIVLMGSGEPLDNYEQTLKFLSIIHHPLGLNISYRNITLSTCGLVPKIRRLAEERLPITLSVSLHAPNDDLRRRIMPIASVHTIDEILESSKYYFEMTGRRVTFEYSLINEFNDREEHALELIRILKGFPCHVNIIPINEVEGSDFKRSSEIAIKKFITLLDNNGIQVTRRREMGQDIKGACGQLRWNCIKNEIDE